MNVIGLDLSLTAPGLATTQILGRTFTETLRTDPKRGDKRLCDIRDWLSYYVGQRPYALAVIEAVPPNATSSAVLERVQAVAREVLARHDVPFAHVHLSALKAYATGDGGADKSEVTDYVERETGRRPADSDQADAWVLHRMGTIFLMDPMPVLDLMPAQVKAIDSVEWPLFPDDPAWPQPYGPIRRKPVRRKCRHGIVCLRNGDHWLHPFNVAVCDKPPK